MSCMSISQVEYGPVSWERMIRAVQKVRMKLTSFRDKDRTHLRDLIEIGLDDASGCERLPREVAERLGELVAHPED